MCVCVRAHTSMRACMHVCMYVHVCMSILNDTGIIYIYIYIYIYMHNTVASTEVIFIAKCLEKVL